MWPYNVTAVRCMPQSPCKRGAWGGERAPHVMIVRVLVVAQVTGWLTNPLDVVKTRLMATPGARLLWAPVF